MATSARDRIKVFGVVNHVSNQYELLKLAKKYPVKFYYLANNVRRWSEYSARPEPTTYLTNDEFEWVSCYKAGDYDVAMLHCDQQHVDPKIGKGQLYRDMNAVITDIPKIVINHGTPMWDELYNENFVINGGDIQTTKGVRHLDGMKKMIGDNFMVVNSYESVERWGWGYPLIHGLDPEEWFDLPKEPRVVISLSPAGLDQYYNRYLLESIKGKVREKCGFSVNHIMLDYVSKDWTDYRNFLGTSLIYINPTKDSPMPRSRTEAMLSGCCVLTSKYHNADEFIEQGVSGLIVPDNPDAYADAIYELINHNYAQAVAIGQAGKEAAKQYFSKERYQADLWNIIEGVANGKPPVWDGSKRWDKE